MHLYIVTALKQYDEWDYCESMLVVAESAEQARNLNPYAYRNGPLWYDWNNPKSYWVKFKIELSVLLVGIAFNTYAEPTVLMLNMHNT